MLERVMRAIRPICVTPSVKAGSAMDRAQPVTLSVIGTKPPVGNHPSATAKV